MLITRIVLADARESRAETADAAHDQVDRDARHREAS